VDFLVTGNCVHIANAKAVARFRRQQGWECPVICTQKNYSDNRLLAKDTIVGEVRSAREEQAAK